MDEATESSYASSGKPDRLGEDGGENPSATSWCRGRLSDAIARWNKDDFTHGTSARLAHETGRALLID